MENYLMRILIIAVIFLFINTIFGQDISQFPQTKIPYAPRSYICYQSGQAINIDGKIDESSWKKTPWTDKFQDIEGYLKPEPQYKTRVKMLWDDVYFYFAAELDESHIWAKLKQRDTVIYYDNDFEIFIDPDSDTHDYFEYEINAFGTEWDLLLTKPYRDGASAINGFDFNHIKSAVAISGTINNPEDEDKGWTIEVAIPWIDLQDCAHMDLPPKSGDQWRVNFSRVQWRTDIVDGNYRKTINPNTNRPYPENNWVWSPQGLIAMHAPETWGIVQFSKKNIGEGIVSFQKRRDEEARWALRKLYYNQRTHHMKAGKFTDSINQLGLEQIKLKHYAWPPTIQTTKNLFEAVLKSNDRKEVWHIIQDGKIWNSVGKSN